MRLSIVSHLFPSEAEPLRGPFVAEQARALQSYADLHVVCGEYRGSDRSASVDGVPVRYLGVPWVRGVPSKAALVVAASAYLRRVNGWLSSPRRRPDLIHAHYGFPDGVVGCLAAKRLGVPAVVTLHGDDANIQMRMPVIGPLVASALSSAAAVICVSEAMRSSLAERFPALAEKAVTVPNGYDARDISMVSPRPPAEYLLFVGTLLPVKNPDMLLRAYARIASMTPLDLAIAGEGPMAPALRRLASELGITHRVRFLGRLTHREVGEAMSRAHALVLPSSHEGMPIVVVEALASGTPVVASAVGGIPELVRDDGLGILVEPDSQTALEKALAMAVSRGWSPAAVASRAPVLTWDDNARIIAGIYERALAPGRVLSPATEGVGERA